jgi:hypothetical protein
MRTRPVLLNKRACAQAIVWGSLYNLYSIQRLMKWKKRWSITVMTVWVDLYQATWHAHRQQERTPTMDLRTLSLQTNGISRLMVMPWIYRKAWTEQSDPQWPPKTRGKELLCALTPASWTVPSLHAKACTYSTSGPILYITYSIEKLESPTNGRSMQISTLWVGLTNTNDMRSDNSRPQQVWTSAQFCFK